WFGPDTINIVQSKIISFSTQVFSPSVVDQIIAPTVNDVLQRGRGDVVSLGFVLSLWAGSSAISSFVDSIVIAHDQHNERNPIWQRIFALLLYAMALLLAVFTIPVIALGPRMMTAQLPEGWRSTADTLIQLVYYPTAGIIIVIGLTTLYKFALPRSLPWHRLVPGALFGAVFFLIAAAVLRIYFTWVTSTGYTYGALASPIAYLLFTFFIGFAVVIGAQFNAAIQAFWPAKATRLDQMRERMQSRAQDSAYLDDEAANPGSGPISNQFARLSARIVSPRSLVYSDPTEPLDSPAVQPQVQSSPPRRNCS
ncbi:MAG: YihY/virulence factor BrkB family protein, partial [Mycobacteriaceae bacterium]